MSWFSVKLLFEAESSSPTDSDVLCEESIRLIEAASEEIALEKAKMLGKDQEHSYENDSGETIFWRFLKVDQAQELGDEEVQDGSEVFSTMRWKKSP